MEQKSLETQCLTTVSSVMISAILYFVLDSGCDNACCLPLRPSWLKHIYWLVLLFHFPHSTIGLFSYVLVFSVSSLEGIES